MTIVSKIATLKIPKTKFLLLIKINDYAWNDIEREEIIKAATDKYLGEKRKKMKMSCEQVLSSPGPSTSTVESADISDSSSGSSTVQICQFILNL